MAQQSDDQQKCINALNAGAAKMGQIQGKENVACLSNAAKGKVAMQQGKLDHVETQKCVSAPTVACTAPLSSGHRPGSGACRHLPICSAQISMLPSWDATAMPMPASARSPSPGRARNSQRHSGRRSIGARTPSSTPVPPHGSAGGDERLRGRRRLADVAAVPLLARRRRLQPVRRHRCRRSGRRRHRRGMPQGRIPGLPRHGQCCTTVFAPFTSTRFPWTPPSL